MTQYKSEFPFPVLFSPVTPKNVLAETLANQKLKQYHCAGRLGFHFIYIHIYIFWKKLYEIYFKEIVCCENIYVCWKLIAISLSLETEKYAHVTFFFNGGCEKSFELEDRKMVPSPKVATYDLQPEMNCAGVGEAVS